jgi:hypothetical protein
MFLKGLASDLRLGSRSDKGILTRNLVFEVVICAGQDPQTARLGLCVHMGVGWMGMAA